MAVKIFALILPILLYIFKYILPSWAEAVYTNRKREKEQAKIEALHFPVDLLFVAVGYTIPKMIEVSSKLTSMKDVTVDMIEEYRNFSSWIVLYGAISIVILMLVPFFVFATKSAENNYFKKRKRWLLQIIMCYAISVGIIVISIFAM